MTVKTLATAFLLAPLFFLTACTSSGPKPEKSNLSVQPHNKPASWEGSAGMGAMMGQQYQD